MGSLSFSWSKDHVYLHAKQVGNWSRWLTDLFGIDDNDSLENVNELDSNKTECETSFKAFQLLNALSDLMMLPFEMLADSSARKEVKHWAEFFSFLYLPTMAFPLLSVQISSFEGMSYIWHTDHQKGSEQFCPRWIQPRSYPRGSFQVPGFWG